ncbi:MAG: beta-ketoacyl-[acyl-carrier-protein] synthase family protein [Lentisphaeria bacterium]|nr:beta-ketoacyl-[acyl-carrier-protein] synthase family protein [Lentisphaeria bacterium]
MTPIPVIGIGQVSALGRGIDAAREGLFRQDVLPHESRVEDSTLRLPIFTVGGDFGHPIRSLGMLLGAVQEALENAQLATEESRQGLRIGVIAGSTVLCNLHHLKFCAALRQGQATENPRPYRDYVDSSPADFLHWTLALNGPALTVSNACTSSADAIGIGCLWLECGLCDAVIAVGIDILGAGPLDGFHALGVFSHEPCRPFDAARNGLNLGEAAAALILGSPGKFSSSYQVAGYSSHADANHITQPLASGKYLEQTIREALTLAEIPPDAIGFINAHGTGTEANDRVEGQTLARVFGPSLKYHSTKGLTGHTLGAAGALEAIFCLLMLEAQTAVRSCRFQNLPEDIPFAPLMADTPFDRTCALSTSLAFGGANSALVLQIR